MSLGSIYAPAGLVPVARCPRGVRSRHPRRAVRVRAERAIFQTDPPCGAATLKDVRDAIDSCCAHTTEHGRSDCFVSFGVDVARADEYFHTVERWEAALQERPRKRQGILRLVSQAFKKTFGRATKLKQNPEKSPGEREFA